MTFCEWWPKCGCGTQSGPHSCEHPERQKKRMKMHFEKDDGTPGELFMEHLTLGEVVIFASALEHVGDEKKDGIENAQAALDLIESMATKLRNALARQGA